MYIVQGQPQTVLTSVWDGRPQIVPTRLWQLMAPELSESQYTAYIARRTSYIARRTSYNVHRCMVPWTLWVCVEMVSRRLYWPGWYNASPWHCTAPWTLRVSGQIVRRTSPVVHRASYIVHRPSYIALRTSYIVRCTSLHVVSVEWVSHRLYWLGRNNVSPWYCTTPWALRVSVHCISTSYIVHRPSYIVHRTSYVGRA